MLQQSKTNFIICGILYFPENQTSVLQRGRQDVIAEMVDLDVGYVVHVGSVAVQVQLPQLVIRTRVLEHSYGAHLVPHHYLIIS